MLGRLLPRRLDNTYRGGRPALWLFALLVLLKTVMGLNSVFNGRAVLASADGVPLDSYPAAASQTIVALFALMSVTNLMVCLLCAVVLFRYRALLPLMFALLLLEHVGRRVALLYIPIVRTGAPPGSFINLALFALMAVGLALSLRGKDGPQAQE